MAPIQSSTPLQSALSGFNFEVPDPIELPNGRLVCGPHRREVCGACCMDFTYMRDVLSNYDSDDDVDGYDDDDDDDDVMSPDEFQGVLAEMEFPKRRGTGRVFPGVFVPPSQTSTPASLVRESDDETRPRFVLRSDPGICLFYTDGACINNGRPDPKAGWAFVFGPLIEGQTCTGRLELEGPFGDPEKQTSNRAELRAVIAALRGCDWHEEGFHTIVIATDSEYAVNGATQWARSWVANGWRTSKGTPVQNKDLWEMLLGEMERCDREEGLRIDMWRIPRAQNAVADRAAKSAAEEEDVVQFRDKLILGI
ncbi:uncharacterized protein DNG_05816 [Cephalotrichum gorgonifer]|uniref:ribonuclease H n=1 Tax=Cephalotrichum gorgonifer TaxID=2041049 RepID=A0AAE8SW21_9PEZI|nr:uncharacterized protein DNG_05816 [Cephalotrichum gorgonifer]